MSVHQAFFSSLTISYYLPKAKCFMISHSTTRPYFSNAARNSLDGKSSGKFPEKVKRINRTALLDEWTEGKMREGRGKAAQGRAGPRRAAQGRAEHLNPR